MAVYQISANVNAQNIAIDLGDVQLVSGSDNVYQVEFEFSDEWTSFTKKVVFYTEWKRSIIEVLLSGTNIVTIPTRSLANSGFLMIGVYGTGTNDEKLPTVWSQKIHIYEGTCQGYENPAAPDPDVYDEILAAMAGKQDILTFDNVPTDGSNNPVKSNGIYDELAAIKALLNAAVIKKEIAQTELASFDDGIKLPFNNLSVVFSATQTGSGDPSPTNIHPISGRTGASVILSPTETAADGTEYSVTWQDEVGTVYGGIIDFATGVLTITHYFGRLNLWNWTYQAGLGGYFRAANKSTATGGTMLRKVGGQLEGECFCSCYSIENVTSISNLSDKSITLGNDASSYNIIVKDSDYGSDADAFKASLPDAAVVVIKRYPEYYTTYQLTPQQINTLIGQNYIWSDDGEVTVRYPVDSKTYIDSLVNGGEATLSALPTLNLNNRLNVNEDVLTEEGDNDAE